MNKTILGLILILISSVSNAALTPILGDAIFGTVGESGCGASSCYLYTSPGTSIDPNEPISNAYPSGFDIYISNPQFDENSGLYYQPEFGAFELYLSSTDNWYKVTKTWKGILGVTEEFINKTFTLTQQIYIAAGDTLGLSAGGIALNSDAFVEYRISVSEVPIPAPIFLLMPVLLMLLKFRSKN